MINAAAFSASLGTPLLLHVTLHLTMAPKFEPSNPMQFQGRFLNDYTIWARDHGIPVRFVWVRENGVAKGPHLHWMVFVPVRFWKRFDAFVQRAGKFQQPPGRRDLPYVRRGGKWGMWKPNLWAGPLKYILKSMCPTARLGSTLIMDALGIDHERTRPMPFLRAGTSRFINRAARISGEWNELETLTALRSVLHPHALD